MEIFKDTQDNEVFLNIIRKAQIIFKFQIYARCLMGNHYHLQIKDVKKQLPSIIGWIQENYAIYFNAKYNHSGAVFMKPFKSKPVYTKNQFFTLYSYIKNNPVKAGKVSEYKDYKWNSPIMGYEKYNITDYLYVNHYYEPIDGLSLHEYILFLSRSKNISDLEVEQLTNGEAEIFFNKIVYEISNSQNFSSETMSQEIQNEIIMEAKYQGINSRQIATFTDIPQHTISRIKITKPYI